MPARKSHEQFVQELQKTNDKIECLDQYCGNHQKIHFRCKECGREWIAVPYSILAGHGCPNCTHSSTSFLEKAILWAFRLCLGTQKVIERDRKEIGMELDILIPSLSLAIEPGSWDWHRGKKERDTEKRSRCAEKGIRLISIYSDYKEEIPPYNLDCIVSHYNLGNSKWDLVRTIIEPLIQEYGYKLSEEQWAEVRKLALDGSKKKTQERFEAELAKVNSSILLLSEYEDSASKVLLSCKKCGQKWEATPNSLLRGHGCPNCKRTASSLANRLSHSEFEKRLKEIAPLIQVQSTYVSSKEKVFCKCLVCDNEWMMTPNALLRGQGCPKCGRKKVAEKKTYSHEKFLKLVAENNPKVEILGEYVRNSQKILVKCKRCGYEWNGSPSTILSGHGCPKCAGVLKRTHEDFEREMKERFPYLTVLDSYVNANTKVRIKCTVCGNEWESRPHDLLRGKGCSKCRKEKGLNCNV